MRFRSFSLLGLLVLLGPIGLLSAQNPGDQENMRFVGALRQRGDFDLARLYLERMKRNASPALASELQLEVAKLLLIEASFEPDSGKRQAMLNDTRREFEQFLARNKTHPRAPEVRMEIGQVMAQQGRVLLSKALSQETIKAQREEGAKARAALEEAGKRLAAAAKEMDFQLEGRPEPRTEKEKGERKRMEEERSLAHLNVALNKVDQAMTYPREDVDRALQRNARVKLAQDDLEKLASGPEASPITWTARAWVARCLFEVGDKDARARLKDAADTRLEVARDARRHAKYFLMLAVDDSKDKGKEKEIEEVGRDWLKQYDRNYKNTPEGYGVRWLLAKIHLGRATAAKGPKKEAELNLARTYLADIEHGDNEYSERARHAKLTVIKEQGGFDKKIEDLKTFEDCFIRAQYEISQIEPEVKKVTSRIEPEVKKFLEAGDKNDLKRQDEAKQLERKLVAEAEKVRQERIGVVLSALDRGLSMPDAKTRRSADVGNARAIQAFYAYNTKHYPACIKYGETFAHDDAQSAQAPTAAMYALQAYSEMLAAKEQNLEKGTGDLLDESGKKVDAPTYAKKLAEDQDRFTRFARYVREKSERNSSWRQAGDLAKHQLALLLFREKAEGAQRVKNFHEAIKALTELPADYPMYSRTTFLLALRAREADQGNIPPLPAVAGQKPMSWKQLAIKAFGDIPEPSGEEGETTEIYFVARGIVAGEMYKEGQAAPTRAEKEKKFEQLDKMTEMLLNKLPVWTFKNPEQREKFKTQMLGFRYYARYGLADAAFQANDHTRVLAVVDPFVEEVRAAGEHPIKNNPPGLANALLIFALRSSVQANKIDRAKAAADAMRKISPNEGQAAEQVLGQVAGLIHKQLEEAAKDKDRRETLIKSFTGLLEDLARDNKKPTPIFVLRLAQAYSNMDQHSKAIVELNKQMEAFGQSLTKLSKELAEEKKKNDQNKVAQLQGEIAGVDKLSHSCQLNLIRELRLNKEKYKEKVRPILVEIVGTKTKPGWGARNPDALLEMIYLLNEEEKYIEAFNTARQLSTALGKNLEDNARRQLYMESYFQMVYAQAKFAAAAKDPAKKERNTNDAAKLILKLEGLFKEFKAESDPHYKDLLKQEPELDKAYKKIKAENSAVK